MVLSKKYESDLISENVVMNRKQILEKQRALGSISQSKTGDAILRKNIFEMRVLKTKLSDLENEQKVWKTHHNYGVKEAKKEAREMAKVRTFRHVAQVALASQRLKNLAPLFNKTQEDHKEVEEDLDLETNTHESAETLNKELKPFPRKVRQPNSENAPRLPPLTLSPQARHFSLPTSIPEKSSNFPSPLIARRRVNTWTGKSVITANSSTAARDVTTPFSSPVTGSMSPMLDKRFLGLKAALVPMHPSEESESEEGRQEDEDSSSDDGFPTCGSISL
ncbi:uncharacterized protein LOC110235368 [Exaiptasia diaphana]|uniref:Uncharacterized protein n=1 Tax=Exaiptasia diaphana TaxID=2652724 RepID=A0A913WZC1_EXADI|nr:uncharacterized protein LOC110235368 [Exaiptasia diaphana]